MERFERRVFVAAAASLPTLLIANFAQATLLRGLSLRDLTKRSDHVLLLTALGARCGHAKIGGRTMIVTETRARVEDVLAQANPDDSEVSVCTLGGVLDGAGQLVHGQAEFVRDAPCAAFLTRAADGSLWVTGMAQGHYPIQKQTDGRQLLEKSPHLPSLVELERSAVRTLAGQELHDARRLVREAAAR